jgi:energy-coupling factor transporter ATP-binding protein EcfA2
LALIRHTRPAAFSMSLFFGEGYALELPTNRAIKTILVALVISLVLISTDILIQVVGGQLGEYLQKNLGISTRALLYALGVFVLLSCFLAIHNALKNRDETEEPRRLTEKIEPYVEKFFDSLKERYQSRYEQKLDGRFEITLEVNTDWSNPPPGVIKERFRYEVSTDWSSRTPQVIRETFTHNANAGEAVEVINQAFAEKGRLLIVGNPGAGKTVLLLKLAVGLLDKIDLAKKEAFPVIFNLASWSTSYESFEDWLKASLESDYDLKKDFAATLLHQERIIFLLDGLDELARNDDEELAAETRGQCLQSLNQYLSRGKKVVICCRRDEFVRLQKVPGHVAPVAVKVAVCDLTKDQIEHALLEAQHKIVDRTSASHISEFIKLERGKVLLNVLRTPFYFTTALEVFEPVLDYNQIPNDADALKKYLLDEFVETKLRSDRTRNLNKFKPDKTKKWLKWLGKELELKRLVNFELSVLQPDSLPRPWKYELLHGVVSVPGILLCFGWTYGLLFGLYVCFKLYDGSDLGLGNYSHIQTEDIHHVNIKNLFSPRKLKRGLLYGLGSGLVASVIFNLRGEPVSSLVAGSALGLFIGAREAVREVSYFVKLNTPYQRLKAGFRTKVLELALVGLLMNALSLSVTRNALVWDNISLLFFSFAGGALIGFSLTPLVRHFILRLCLYLQGATPLQYAAFLDYAAEARILEKDGGQWRFRHQNLHEYFADIKGIKFERRILP